MSSLSKFIVLIERRRLVLGLSSLALAAAALFPLKAVASAGSKIATDLQAVIDAPTTPVLNWTKDVVGGVRMVKVLVISNSSDPDLAALRADVIARGGSVYFRYTSVRALSVMLPANKVANIAGRSDVVSISPNRLTARTVSALEQITGTSNVRIGNSNTAYTGYDGAGVGIAVLDSGIWRRHQHFGGQANTRVLRAVNFLRKGAGDAQSVGVKTWAAGVDASAGLYPGSTTMATYEYAIKWEQAFTADAYGHGTHVAAIAAGAGAYQSLDSTGIAPKANLFDVKVLDDNGFGQLSDVLAGIDWVLYNAKTYNIRVLNLSLAADSTETHQTDPLAIAVRSATAAGITVVVAGGNFGQTATGRATLRHDQLARP